MPVSRDVFRAVEVTEFSHVDLIRFKGIFNNDAAEEVSSLLEQSVDGYTHVVIDLLQVTFLSTAVLRELVVALKEAKKHGTELVLVANENSRVWEVLELAALTSLFQIFATDIEAVGAV